MSNKQPFYHRSVILFTATRELSREDMDKICRKLKFEGLVKGSAECEEIDAEPGDPADLVE